jgi:hypothetical protein
VTHKQATKAAHDLPCCLCGTKPCEPCHHPTHRGMGGAKAGWDEHEWVPMCRTHHDALDGRLGPSHEWLRHLCLSAALRYQVKRAAG